MTKYINEGFAPKKGSGPKWGPLPTRSLHGAYTERTRISEVQTWNRQSDWGVRACGVRLVCARCVWCARGMRVMRALRACFARPVCAWCGGGVCVRVCVCMC